MVWGKLPADGVEGGDEFGGCGGPELWEELGGGDVGVEVDLCGDDGEEGVSDEGIDFLDA